MKSALPIHDRLCRFGRSAAGAAAVEFALVAIPFLFLILGVLQVGIYYLVQSSLDAGIIGTADALRSSFSTTSPTFPNASTLKTEVVAHSGGMIRNDSTLAVEIRQLTSLDSAVLPVTDGTIDYGSATSTLVLRARSSVVTFAPGFGSLANVSSSAILRRQGN
jgi:Flp pilus assembly protein TadG